MKLFLIGGLLGLALGVALTVVSFSLATFFDVNAKALNSDHRTVTKGDEHAHDASTIEERKAG